MKIRCNERQRWLAPDEVRLLGEDYVPCDGSPEAYSDPYTTPNSGWEVAYFYDAVPPIGDQVPSDICNPAAYANGRLVAVRDRAAETTTSVDGRGRVICTARRIGTPLGATEDVAEPMHTRYVAGQWFYKKAAYDAADRPIAETVGGVRGASLSAFNGAPELFFPGDAQDAQTILTNYTKRGTVQSVSGSYGTLVKGIKRRADGLVTNLIYGDSAGTQTSTTYDDRRRPTSIQTFRGTSALWSSFAPGGSGETGIGYAPAPPNLTTPATNFQLLLEDTDIAYDEVGNPVELRDWREPTEWPAGNKPVTKKVEYDDLYRVKRMDYLYATQTGMDDWKSPFEQENTENPDPTVNTTLDPRRARPVPHLKFTNRPQWQSFDYDWLGNLSTSDDDAHGGYDRSLGVQSHSNANKPYQLSSATNSSLVGTTGITATVTTKFDAAGNMTRLGVVRPAGACAAIYGNTAPPCRQFYAYDYDEVGRLYRARRWDSTTAQYNAETQDVAALGTAAVDLRYRYDASDQRVIKRVYDGTVANQRHTLYAFGSLEVHRTTYTGSAYSINNKTLVPYAMANGVRLARLHFDDLTAVPKVTGVPEANGGSNTISNGVLHVLLELGDHLGSTGTVLDKVSSELVQKTGYSPFGARENDYRPARWAGFREDYGFTGKEEDVEVGLTYFGKRYLSAQLGRWVSADPLAVHAPGEADFNLYAYVSGAVLKNVDPVGLQEAAADEVDVDAEGTADALSVKPTSIPPSGEPLDSEKFVAETHQLVEKMQSSQRRTSTAPAVSAPSDGAFEKGVVNGLVRSFPALALTEMSGPDAKTPKVYNDGHPAGEATGLIFGGMIWNAIGELALAKTMPSMRLTPPAMIAEGTGSTGAGMVPKPTIDAGLRAEIAAALDEANSSTTTLFHGGVLRGGKVGAGDFSTTPSFAHASQYADMRGGQVHRFDVPNSVLREARMGQGVQELTDSLAGTSSSAQELKFMGDFSLRLNDYHIKAP